MRALIQGESIGLPGPDGKMQNHSVYFYRDNGKMVREERVNGKLIKKENVGDE